MCTIERLCSEVRRCSRRGRARASTVAGMHMLPGTGPFRPLSVQILSVRTRGHSRRRACLRTSPSAAAPNSATQPFNRAHSSARAPLLYLRSSTAPEHMFSWVSIALPARVPFCCSARPHCTSFQLCAPACADPTCIFPLKHCARARIFVAFHFFARARVCTPFRFWSRACRVKGLGLDNAYLRAHSLIFIPRAPPLNLAKKKNTIT